LLGLRSLPVRTVIDVGANAGQFATTISTLFPEARLVCFEPQEQPFLALKHWADRQARGRVLVSQTAIGDKEGFVDFRIHTNHDVSSSVLATTCTSHILYPFTRHQQVQPVPVTTLDLAIERLNVAIQPDLLIKIDAQGYDDRVILGATRLFAKARAAVIEIILDGLYEGQAGFTDILYLMTQLGFKYAGNLDQTYAKDGHVIFIDALFVR
jgi:FkbM family methyltransferase